MNQMPDDELDQLLDSWSIPTPSSRNLKVLVRQKIETSDAKQSGLIEAISTVFEKPTYATMFVLSCALLGIFLAEIKIAKLQSERNRMMAVSYLHLIDPLLQENHTEDGK